MSQKTMRAPSRKMAKPVVVKLKHGTITVSPGSKWLQIRRERRERHEPAGGRERRGETDAVGLRDRVAQVTRPVSVGSGG
jgi:tRNA nucleotidyltransferase/poly(A) polymerase